MDDKTLLIQLLETKLYKITNHLLGVAINAFQEKERAKTENLNNIMIEKRAAFDVACNALWNISIVSCCTNDIMSAIESLCKKNDNKIWTLDGRDLIKVFLSELFVRNRTPNACPINKRFRFEE